MCIKLTGNIQVKHVVMYKETKDEESLIEMTLPLYEQGAIKRLYTGITANPPEGSIAIESLEFEARNPDVHRSITPYPTVTTPFTNYNKKFLAKLYEDEGILEQLFPLTFSCEYIGDPKEDPGMEHCGECWWCEERQWGFDRLK